MNSGHLNCASRKLWLISAVLGLSLGAQAGHADGAPRPDAGTSGEALAQVTTPELGVKPNIPPVQAPSPVPATPPKIDVQTPEGGTPNAVPAGTSPSLYIRDEGTKSSNYSVQVDEIAIYGNKVIPTADLLAAVAQYVHRKLEPTDVEAARNALTLLYVNRGYMNSGALPPKYDATTHVLGVVIVEGHLTEIQAHGQGWLRQSYIADRLVGSKDEVLNMNVLRERFQTLLTDPLIERANAKLLPGAQPGQAILDLDVERARPYGLTAYGNNYRPPSIGSQQFGVDAWIRNLSGLGDLLDVNFQKHPGGSGYGSTTRGANWHFPFNAGRAEFSAEADRGASNVIDAALIPLGINSESSNQDIGLKDVVWNRGLARQLTLGVDYVHRNSQSWLLGQPYSFTAGSPDGHVAEHGFRGWGEFSWRTERQVAVARLTYSRLENNLVSQPGAPYVVNAVRNHVQYVLAQGQYNRVILDDGTQLVTKVILQQSPQALPSLDEISIGGVATVRGYVENEYVRDIGRVVSIELDHPYALARGSITGTVGPFLDLGQAKNVGQASGQDAANLGSIGLALHAAWRGLRLDFSYGKRVMHPAGEPNYGTTMQEHGVELQLSYDFFPKSSAVGK